MARPVVHLTDTASLRGNLEYARNSQKPIRAFLGIPYAAPPVGSLRFQPPQPVKLWTGERDASKFGAVSPQDMKMAARTYAPFPVPEVTSEDCLFLNVWTPTASQGQGHLPVMVWIHGGAYIQGYGDIYPGTALCTFHDVIVVSINYRLGPFGFMCTGDGVVRGNMALQDQLEALRWVRQHIDKFGGNPDNVTVFGESAGGIFSALHIISPLAGGLFRRAICQSGTSTYTGLLWPAQNARKYLMKKLQQWGFSGTSGQEMVDFLSSKSGQEVVDRIGGGGFNPILDGQYLTEPPLTSLLEDRFQRVDLMLGFNTHEGTGFVFEMAKSRKMKNFEAAVKVVEETVKVRFFRGNPNADSIVAAILNEYKLEEKRDNPDKLMESLVDMYGDLLFVAPSLQLADAHSGAAPTFVYKFDHRPPYSTHPDWVGADHGNEIPYVFGKPFLDRLPDIWPESDKELSRLLMKYWTNFAKTGNPNGASETGHMTPWPQYSSTTAGYIRLKDDGANACWRHQPDRAHFWNVTVPELAANNTAAQQPKSKY